MSHHWPCVLQKYLQNRLNLLSLRSGCARSMWTSPFGRLTVVSLVGIISSSHFLPTLAGTCLWRPRLHRPSRIAGRARSKRRLQTHLVCRASPSVLAVCRSLRCPTNDPLLSYRNAVTTQIIADAVQQFPISAAKAGSLHQLLQSHHGKTQKHLWLAKLVGKVEFVNGAKSFLSKILGMVATAQFFVHNTNIASQASKFRLKVVNLLEHRNMQAGQVFVFLVRYPPTISKPRLDVQLFAAGLRQLFNQYRLFLLQGDKTLLRLLTNGLFHLHNWSAGLAASPFVLPSTPIVHANGVPHFLQVFPSIFPFRKTCLPHPWHRFQHPSFSTSDQCLYFLRVSLASFLRS